MAIVLDEEIIPQGNFEFLNNVLPSKDLFLSLFEAESYLKINCVDFAHKLRMAFERFAIEEYIGAEFSKPGNSLSKEHILEHLMEEIKAPASTTNFKTIIISLCRGRELDFKEMLSKNSFLKSNNTDIDVVKRMLGKFIRSVYSFGSVNSHGGSSSYATYDECLKYISAFHDFLIVYYNAKPKKYDPGMSPIRSYVPVPKQTTQKIGLDLEQGKYLYVRDTNGRISFYIFSQENAQSSKSRRRDIETIEKLWDDNFDDPANIIRQIDQLQGVTPAYNFRVYALPSKPLRLSNDLIKNLSFEDKIDIVKGIYRGLSSIHDYHPPLFHRNICPDAFYIFKIKGRYKALLSKFDCVKDTSPDADYTVLKNVESRVANASFNQFFAPEVKSLNSGSEIDWEKADVFSFALLSTFILSDAASNFSELESTIDQLSIQDEFKIILMEMLNSNPIDRPRLSVLRSILL